MDGTIIISKEKFKRLCGCFQEIEKILENLEARELKAPKLTKAERLELKMQKLFSERITK